MAVRFASLILYPLLGAAQDDSYFPSNQGVEWSYSVSTGQGMTIRVAGTARVKDVECAVVETTMGGQTTREYLAAGPEGLKAYKVENAAGAMEFDTPVLRAKLPVKEGDAWTVKLREELAVNTYQYRCEGVETVQVAAGRFECLKVSTTLQTFQGRMTITCWYGKGKGLVKQAADVNGQTMAAELMKSTLAPARPSAAR